jgi:LruC domain-containing protein
MTKTKTIWAACGLIAVIVSGAASLMAQTAAVSGLLDSNHINKGVGDSPLTAAQRSLLPSYVDTYNAISGQSAGRTAIAFGVDINEAANGTEKATTQAVTVEYAWLEVIQSGVTKNYGSAPTSVQTTESGSSFYTETQAVVAPKGSTTRAKYYTLLGRSGSAAITGMTSTVANYDSTLKIVIPAGANLSNATSAILHIRLLDTNVNLGDPEAFYDFTAGFEDVAILTKPDAVTLDTNVDALSARTEAPAIQLSTDGTSTAADFNLTCSTYCIATSPTDPLVWIQRPGSENFNLVAYEDLYPQQGDYDFNDLLVAYNYSLGVNGQGKVEKMIATAYILARGSTYRHSWTLKVPFTGASSTTTNVCEVFKSDDQASISQTTANSVTPVVGVGCTATIDTTGFHWNPFENTVSLFPGTDAGAALAALPINANNNMIRGPKATLAMTIGTPVSLSKFQSDDPWIRVTRNDNSTVDVHLTDKDSNNFPFAMMMPSVWKWPLEGKEIALAYSTFLSFVSSAGTSALNWYESPTSANVNSTGANNEPWSKTNWAW